METTLKHIKDSFNNTTSIEVGNFPVRVKEKEKCFAAFSPHFKTLGFGETLKDAINDLRTSLDTFFDVHEERGTLDFALTKLGWEKNNDTFKRPKYFNHEGVLAGGVQKTLQYA